MIHKVHERVLRIVGRISDSETLLQKNNDISCRHMGKNVQEWTK